MTLEPVSAARPAARSSWFPWRHPAHDHPALQAAHDERTFGERVADEIASFGGSWPFIFIFIGLIGLWIVVNTVLIQHVLSHRAFDPYPYIALNLVLSGLAGIQAPIIMMSQNRAAARDEILASHHYIETHKIDELLESNTDLTQKVHDLTQRIHQLATQIAIGTTPARPSPDAQ
ncbi:MAG TPA: DUF1003 domain-containing protein [Acidimicrobiales bacterium]|nr:DUF1003 domain-containing protein [Acidimicrobiales bacterium]